MLISQQHINLPNAVTLLGVIFALCACGFAGAVQFDWSAAALIMSGVCDLLDGLLARRSERNQEQSAYGAQLDSLVDVISFGVTPAVIAYFLTEPHAYTAESITLIEVLWVKFVAIFFVICAILRLAHFNVAGLTKVSNSQKQYTVYQGLPVTYIALIMPLVYLLSGYLFPSLLVLAVSVALFVVAILFVSNISIPKPYGMAYPAFLALAFLMILVLLV